MEVRLLAKTVGIEGTEFSNKSIDEIIVGIARISSSRETNELFDEPDKLLRHCISNGHWSIFSQANLTFEVITSRFVGRELLRHWSLKPQELSQRYAEIVEFEDIELRKQSSNNRQSSTTVVDKINLGDISFEQYMPYGTKLGEEVYLTVNSINSKYQQLLSEGIARETARSILPECAQTKLIFNGAIRDWITTLNQRLHKTAQKECRLVAEAIRDIFIQQCPIISSSLFNFEDCYDIHILERVVLEKYGVYPMIKSNSYRRIK